MVINESYDDFSRKYFGGFWKVTPESVENIQSYYSVRLASDVIFVSNFYDNDHFNIRASVIGVAADLAWTGTRFQIRIRDIDVIRMFPEEFGGINFDDCGAFITKNNARQYSRVLSARTCDMQVNPLFVSKKYGRDGFYGTYLYPLKKEFNKETALPLYIDGSLGPAVHIFNNVYIPFNELYSQIQNKERYSGYINNYVGLTINPITEETNILYGNDIVGKIVSPLGDYEFLSDELTFLKETIEEAINE